MTDNNKAHLKLCYIIFSLLTSSFLMTNRLFHGKFRFTFSTMDSPVMNSCSLPVTSRWISRIWGILVHKNTDLKCYVSFISWILYIALYIFVCSSLPQIYSDTLLLWYFIGNRTVLMVPIALLNQDKVPFHICCSSI